jgi:hypothetical protein
VLNVKKSRSCDVADQIQLAKLDLFKAKLQRLEKLCFYLAFFCGGQAGSEKNSESNGRGFLD